jgi:beta-glucosidase
MSIIDDNGKRVIEPGEFLVSVGGKQPGFSGSADAETTGSVGKKFEVSGALTEVAER